MPDNLNYYDTGHRLEPKPWVRNGVTGNEEPRQAILDDYGRVDFEDDEGNTVFTARIQKTEEGYILRIDEHTDGNLVVETSSDRHLREAAMQHIDRELRTIAESRPGALVYVEDGDVSAFSQGHYEFISERDDRHGFYVTEEYVGTNPYDDPDAVPNSWTYRAEAVQQQSGQLDQIVRTTEGRVDTSNLNDLFDAATTWVNELPDDSIHSTGAETSIRQRIESAGIKYPAESYWNEMGSSEKDMWEERQLRSMDRATSMTSLPQPAPSTNYPSM